MFHSRLTAAVLLAAASTAASADVLGHLSENQITFPSPPADVRLGAHEDDANVFVFHESDFTVSGGFAVDHAAVGLVDAVAELATTALVDGQQASSYHVHLDSVGSGGADVTASITFSTEILGVLVRDASLTSTNSSLGAPGTMYGPDGGLELSPDSFEISADRRTLTLRMNVSIGVDRLRVIVDNPVVGLVHDYNFEGNGIDCVSGADILMGASAQYRTDSVPFALGQAFRIGAASGFDAAGTISSSEFLNLATTDFTIAFSMRRLQLDIEDNDVVIDAATNNGWVIVMPQGGFIRFSASGQDVSADSPSLAFGSGDNEWHHLAFTCDRSEIDGARWYFDGELVSADDATLFASLAPDVDDILYATNTNRSEPMDGQMGRMRVYNYALDAEQVLALASEAGLVAEPPATCDADFDNDGVVNASDLAIILAAWGMCP